MELKQLSYFVAVVEEGSFSAAARKLFMSQPPITTQVKALEEELGCALLVRGTRAVRPTEEGRLLYDRARLMLEMRRSVTEEIEARSISGGGTLRLGVVSSVASSLLPGWLSGFHALNPKVRLELYEDNSCSKSCARAWSKRRWCARHFLGNNSAPCRCRRRGWWRWGCRNTLPVRKKRCWKNWPAGR